MSSELLLLQSSLSTNAYLKYFFIILSHRDVFYTAIFCKECFDFIQTSFPWNVFLHKKRQFVYLFLDSMRLVIQVRTTIEYAFGAYFKSLSSHQHMTFVDKLPIDAIEMTEDINCVRQWFKYMQSFTHFNLKRV